MIGEEKSGKGVGGIKKKDFFRWGLTAFLTVCAVLVFYDTFYQNGTLQHFVTRLASVLAPVLYGLALAYLLMPLVKLFERGIVWGLHHMKLLRTQKPEKGGAWLRAGAILLTWAVVLALLYWLMSVLIPQLVDSVTLLINNAQSYYEKVYHWVDDWLVANPEIGSWANETLTDYYEDALTFLTQKVLPWAQKMATSLTGGIWTGIWSLLTFVKNLVVGIIISVYLLAMQEKSMARCCKAIYAIFHEATAALILRGAHQTNVIFSGFVRGKLLDSLIIGILCFIGCSVLKIPYTPLVSVVVGITNVIPFFGPFLGAIPSAFLILLVDPMRCLYFIIFILLLQQLDGNVIGPKILGENTGISSFWVIVAILVGGGFGGVLGMFLGVPVFACLQMLIKWLMDGRLQKRGMPIAADAYVNRQASDEASASAADAAKTETDAAEESEETNK